MLENVLHQMYLQKALHAAGQYLRAINHKLVIFLKSPLKNKALDGAF